MNALVTRRALLGATAAVGASALPAIAKVAIPSSCPDHPDAELFRLLAAWGPARAVADAASERASTIWDACTAQEPPRPEALRWRGDDGLNCGFDIVDLPGGRCVAFYGLGEVGKLMSSPPPTRSEWRGGPAPWDEHERAGQWVYVPDERAIARRAEVLTAHHGWMEQCRAVRERFGMDEADEVAADACETLCTIEATILATAPLTMAGLAAKARWASWEGLPRAAAEMWAKQVTADVLVLAERSGVAT